MANRTKNIPSEAQVLEWMTSLSNWGRWGEDDQKGCLNLITPDKRKQAAALVQDGITVSCARPITTEIQPDTTFQVQRYMVDSGEGRDTDPPERRLVRRGASEFIGMVFHGQTITHIDALSHYSWQGRLYNGKPASVITSREGAQSHSIEVAAQGIVTRGVLLDITRVRGADWLEPTDPVMPEDLEAAERLQGVRVEEGDILLVRTGNYRMRLETGRVPNTQPSTACQVACTPLVQGAGRGHAGDRHLQRHPPQPLRHGNRAVAHGILGDPGHVADRQHQSGTTGGGLRRAGSARVHAFLGAFGSAERNRQSGQSDSDILDGFHTQVLGPKAWNGTGKEGVKLIYQTAIVKLCSHLSGCMLNSCFKSCAIGVAQS